MQLFVARPVRRNGRKAACHQAFNVGRPLPEIIVHINGGNARAPAPLFEFGQSSLSTRWRCALPKWILNRHLRNQLLEIFGRSVPSGLDFQRQHKGNSPRCHGSAYPICLVAEMKALRLETKTKERLRFNWEPVFWVVLLLPDIFIAAFDTT